MQETYITTSDSSANDGAHSQQPKQGDGETTSGVNLKAQRANWAERWFAGAASCPACGGDDMTIVRTHGEGSFLIERWRCATSGCLGRWRIEWRESAAGIDDDTDVLGADWYERETDTLKFQIVVEDGIVTGVGAAPGSVISDPFPHFVVRNYETCGFDGKQVSGIDEAGRAYIDRAVSMMLNPGGDDQSVCSLFVASTAHATAEEAQSLTDHGYARGEYGFFFYAAGDPGAMLSELGSLSEGLRAIIREALRRSCPYVLLDRDASEIPGVPVYPW